MTKCVFNISELSNNHKMLELGGYELPRHFFRSSEEKLSAVTAQNTSIMANNIQRVDNPIKESHLGIWLVAFDMGLSEPYWKSSVDGQSSSKCQRTFKVQNWAICDT